MKEEGIMEGREKGRKKMKNRRERMKQIGRGWAKRQRHVCVLSHSVVSDPL